MSLIAATLDRIAAPERRTMAVACGAHVLHDGYTDLLYVLLPLWQAEFGLGYAEIGLLRALFAGSMGNGNGAWDLARQTVREQILTLPAETLLCPGHGPLTTVAEEKAHNPFF